MMKLIRLMCVFLSLVLQFRSRRSSARRVWRERCVTASVLTPLCTHTLAWQPDTHSWSRMAPVYVMIPQKHTHHVTLFVDISDLYELRWRCKCLSPPSLLSLLASCASSWRVTTAWRFWRRHTRHRNTRSWSSFGPALVRTGQRSDAFKSFVKIHYIKF